MGQNDCHSGLQSRFKPGGISHRLIPGRKSKLVTAMGYERHIHFSHSPVKRYIPLVRRIELLHIGKNLYQHSSPFTASFEFFQSIRPRRIDGNPGQQLRIPAGPVQNKINSPA